MLSWFINSGLVLAALLVLPAVAAPTVANKDASAISRYGIEELTWELQTAPGGPAVNVTGTIEQAYKHMKTINPGFISDFGFDQPVNVSSLSTPLESRGYTIDHITCDVFEWAFLEEIQTGMFYLNKVPGKPTNGPGPGNCGRVSCSYGAAIYWCNDTVVNNCPQSIGSWNMGPYAELTKGQIFMTDNWNVIVRACWVGSWLYVVQRKRGVTHGLKPMGTRYELTQECWRWL
ncbi:hypothetical protein NEUTE1DRAFT_98715 [Neurospora tetrasperma FGSC 2508]|uniref:Uncharacterized protein n=1 Tax=Neurospora tetrasperma (strain FGSC 2508 / ATCC MYA-4615 / P0657) TaxID=510951 RepID=F8MEF2_NEUT8|nr:uncharacterized protein NEUTE1DRAFT_98715 [Neurospora tetrasperma FGSC 2508]EGO61634.1 hypothetical protein NEUTE1DRAFT_98715 [Neurospora tetrasperma FGSC 2508]